MLSILDQALRRFSNAFRDVGAFVAEMHTVKEHVRIWRQRVRHMDQEKLGAIQKAIDELRVELRGMAEEMDVSEAKMKEAEEGAGLIADRAATGEHLLLPENRALLQQGDVTGMQEYLINIDPVIFRQAVKRAKGQHREKMLDLLQIMKGEMGRR